jgi:glutamate N-acetyltransferase/amino-acid N-acetyltransferase
MSVTRAVAGGITAAPGFRVAAARAGLRSGPSPDVCLIVSERGPVAAAATFTTNRFRAAPVTVAADALKSSGGHASAIVVNAGCANAGTGKPGVEDARRVQAAVAERLGCRRQEVLVASTGLIGSRLDVERIEAVLPTMQPSRGPAAGREAATSIMTTDTRPKQAAFRADGGGGRTITVSGMAKGAGMIHPQMATMLAFLTTDAPIAPGPLHDLLRSSVERSFNQLTIDGDQSTNDAVMILAGGDGAEIEPGSAAGKALGEALDATCISLAQQIAADGEGATRRIDVTVGSAANDREARLIARTVAGSSLVKSAVHGGDPNWGRIAAAAGRSGARLEPGRLVVRIGSITVYDGEPVAFSEAEASRALKRKVVGIGLELGLGAGRGEAWGCDLSAEYVAINSEYRT